MEIDFTRTVTNRYTVLCITYMYDYLTIEMAWQNTLKYVVQKSNYNHCRDKSIPLSYAGPPRELLGPRAKGNLPPPSILQIMILKLSLPRCVIPVSKESAQQNLIDELWFRKQLSTCLFGPPKLMGPREPPRLPPPPLSTLSGPDHTYTWLFSFLAWYKWNLWKKVTSTYKRQRY